jgi:DNA-binding CsgD family transcriptional regulator
LIPSAHAVGGCTRGSAVLHSSEDLLRQTLDTFDVGVLVLSIERGELLRNAKVRELFGERLPSEIRDAIEDYVLARKQTPAPPPAMRVEIGERSFYVRVTHAPGSPSLEIVQVREEILRDSERFRLLNGRYRVSRREFQILVALGLGKTNRQIANDFGVAAATVARHVHNLLGRFDVPNRTRLANLIEQLMQRRV